MRALEGADLQCVQKAGRKGSAMAARTLKARTRCQSRLDRGIIPAGVECMAGIPPYGNGTGDRATDNNIEAAYIRLLAGVPEVCASADVDALGCSAACDDPTGGRFNIFDLKSCQFNTHRDAVEDLLEASYPKAPVCGNGIHEYGEEGSLFYISMELVVGQDLKGMLRERGPLPWEEAYSFAVGAAIQEYPKIKSKALWKIPL